MRRCGTRFGDSASVELMALVTMTSPYSIDKPTSRASYRVLFCSIVPVVTKAIGRENVGADGARHIQSAVSSACSSGLLRSERQETDRQSEK